MPLIAQGRVWGRMIYAPPPTRDVGKLWSGLMPSLQHEFKLTRQVADVVQMGGISPKVKVLMRIGLACGKGQCACDRAHGDREHGKHAKAEGEIHPRG